MTIKLFIDSDNSVTLSCPVCNKSRVVDASRYIDRDRAVRIQAKCSCGHSYPVILERRRQHRKSVLLSGTFTCDPSRASGMSAPCRGAMTVIDISRGGVRLRFNPMPDLRIGDMINVEFTLNDARQTRIIRDVLIQNVAPPFAGAKFYRRHHLDNEIGFYLFNSK